MEQPDIARLRISRPPSGSVSLPNRFFSGKKRGYLVAFGIILLGILSWHRLSPRPVDITVGNVVTLYPSQVHTLLTATGYVVPQTRADVASKATGRLEKMQVAAGDRVKKGDILARIEDSDVRAALARAEADIETAQTTLASRLADLGESQQALRRADALILKRFISPAAHEAEQARHERARAAVAQAKSLIHAAQASRQTQRVALEYTLIRAPFDGVILSKNADAGDMLAPFGSTGLSKGSVVSMADMDTLEVETDVSESSLLKVYPQQPCEVQLDAIPDERFACQVASIVPTLDRSKATLLVKVRFTRRDGRFLPDMSARVAFLSTPLSPDQRTARRVVPTRAIQTEATEQRVYRLLPGDTVQRIVIRPGETLGEYTEIDPVLQTGDPVVLDPPAGLMDGALVRTPKP
jgi:RND family efflux transporter MFP subunit